LDQRVDERRSARDGREQVDRSRRSASQQGVGLGLAISRNLAPDLGSTFTLALPAAAPDER
jgi:signal transduction histidine kinase